MTISFNNKDSSDKATRAANKSMGLTKMELFLFETIFPSTQYQGGPEKKHSFITFDLHIYTNCMSQDRISYMVKFILSFMKF